MILGAGQESGRGMDTRNGCVLITGAGRRLGAALAQALADRGVALALHYHRSAAEAESLARELKARAREVWLFRADLRSPAEQERLCEETLRHCKRLTGLVNCAAVFERTPLETFDRTLWNEALAVNLTAPVWLSVRLGREMKRAGGGSIVQIGDWSTPRPYKDYLAYSTSKGALETATRALAKELAPQVRVNLVALGPILLPEGSGPDYRERVERAVPLGRVGGSEAFVASTLHLLLDAPFTTGTILTVDGGRSLA